MALLTELGWRRGLVRNQAGFPRSESTVRRVIRLNARQLTWLPKGCELRFSKPLDELWWDRVTRRTTLLRVRLVSPKRIGALFCRLGIVLRRKGLLPWITSAAPTGFHSMPTCGVVAKARRTQGT